MESVKSVCRRKAKAESESGKERSMPFQLLIGKRKGCKVYFHVIWNFVNLWNRRMRSRMYGGGVL